jgi:hypothetical protein
MSHESINRRSEIPGFALLSAALQCFTQQLRICGKIFSPLKISAALGLCARFFSSLRGLCALCVQLSPSTLLVAARRIVAPREIIYSPIPSSVSASNETFNVQLNKNIFGCSRRKGEFLNRDWVI